MLHQPERHDGADVLSRISRDPLFELAPEENLPVYAWKMLLLHESFFHHPTSAYRCARSRPGLLPACGSRFSPLF